MESPIHRRIVQAGGYAALEGQLHRARQWDTLTSLYLDDDYSTGHTDTEWGDRVDRLERALRSSTDLGDKSALHLLIGRVYEERLRRNDRAMLSYQKAFKANPRSTEPIERSIQIYVAMDDWRMVVRLRDIILKVERRPSVRVELLRAMARAERAAGDHRAAERSLAEADSILVQTADPSPPPAVAKRPVPEPVRPKRPQLAQGQVLVAVSSDCSCTLIRTGNTLFSWKVSGETSVAVPTHEPGAGMRYAVSGCGTYILDARSDLLRCFDSASGEARWSREIPLPQALWGHPTIIGTRWVALPIRGAVIVLDAGSGAEVAILSTQRWATPEGRFQRPLGLTICRRIYGNADGSLLAVVCNTNAGPQSNHVVFVFDMEHHAAIYALEGHAGGVADVGFDRLQRIYTLDRAGTVRLFVDGRLRAFIHLSSEAASRMWVDALGRAVVTGQADHVTVLDYGNDREIRVSRPPGDIRGAALSGGNARLILADRGFVEVALFDSDTKRVREAVWSGAERWQTLMWELLDREIGAELTLMPGGLGAALRYAAAARRAGGDTPHPAPPVEEALRPMLDLIRIYANCAYPLLALYMMSAWLAEHRKSPRPTDEQEVARQTGLRLYQELRRIDDPDAPHLMQRLEELWPGRVAT